MVGLRGKGGGYRLSAAPERFTVGRILRLTEESLSPVACLENGAAPCAKMADCRTLPMWQGLDKVIADYLERFTIADLMRQDQPGDNYII